MWNQKLGPAALLWSIVCSNLLLVAGFGSPSILSHLRAHDPHASLHSRAPWLIMSVFGLISSLAAERLLHQGVKHKEWTASQLAPVRHLLRSSAVSMLVWALVAGALLSEIVVRSSHSLGITWCFFGPFFALNRVRTMFQTEPSPPIQLVPRSLSDAQPLHSARWGV